MPPSFWSGPESHPLPHPLQGRAAPAAAHPPLPRTLAVTLLALTLSLEARHILSLVVSALPGLSASLLPPSPTLRCLGKPHKTSLPCPPQDVPLGCTDVGGQGFGAEQGVGTPGGAHTPANGPGGTPGLAQGSDLAMAWGTTVASLLAALACGSWQVLRPQAGSMGIFSMGLVGASWSRSTPPAQRAGVLLVLRRRVCVAIWGWGGGREKILHLYRMHLIYTSVNIHLLGVHPQKCCPTEACNQNRLAMVLERREVAPGGRKLLHGGGPSRAARPAWSYVSRCGGLVRQSRVRGTQHRSGPAAHGADGPHPAPACSREGLRASGQHLAPITGPGWALTVPGCGAAAQRGQCGMERSRLRSHEKLPPPAFRQDRGRGNSRARRASAHACSRFNELSFNERDRG